MNRTPGPILSPKEREKDGAPDLPGITASLIGKGGPPGRVRTIVFPKMGIIDYTVAAVFLTSF
jgi:hypothetical protein